MRLVVDGMNVIGSRPDGWWRDRDGAVMRLARRLEDLALDPGEVVTVVFDGRRPAAMTDGASLRILFAGPRRGAADDRIVEEVGLESSAPTVVVTADRGLAARVGVLGAEVRGPRWLLARLEAQGGHTGHDVS